MKRLTIIFLAAMMFAACNTGVNPTKETTSADASAKVYDCDEQPDDMVANGAKMQKRATETDAIPFSDAIVFFECIGENTLRIRCQETINCAGTLSAECIKNGNKILLSLIDSESELQANCICSHWIEQVLTDLPYGKYEVTCNYLYVSPTSYSAPVGRWQYELEFNEATNISVNIKESHENNVTNNISGGDERIYTELAIVKLTPEMQEHVFVTPIVDHIRKLEYIRKDSTDGKTYTWDAWHGGDSLIYTDTLSLCNTQFGQLYVAFAQQQLGLTGTSPYIMLENGYAIIDWKWSLFHALSGETIQTRNWMPLGGNHYSTNSYYYNGTLANEEYYLLSIKWEELKDITSVWKVEEGTKIDKPEIKYITLKKLEEYGQAELSYMDIYNKYMASDLNLHYAQMKYSNNTEEGEAFINDVDRLQSFYVETLNKMIENNDIEKYEIIHK